jgi:hypothetical protein
MTIPSTDNPPSPETAVRLTAHLKLNRTAASWTMTPPMIVSGKSGNPSKNSEPRRPKP